MGIIDVTPSHQALGVCYHLPLPLDRPPEVSGNLSPLLQSPIGKSPPTSSLRPVRPPLEFLRPEPLSRPPRTSCGPEACSLRTLEAGATEPSESGGNIAQVM
ncbi:hypothetical protein FGLOB1_870 [Fusarium globosum]|uniref:Uncharacterized protein n=1 Tax=Fusarium globosum TaxID=78864 RepID=A0A8H6DKJ3_9HYPO|nr:hypothetical protein FGLOB1_870 [Fusarium globosum]